MSNEVYLPWKQALLSGSADTDISQAGATVAPFCALLTASYVKVNTHSFYTQLIGSPDAVVGTDQQIGAPTVTNGTFDGNDLTYNSVTGLSPITAFAIYRKNTGANSTWKLVLYEDTGVTGLPVTPNGGNITVTWNASGILFISDAERKEDIRKVGQIGAAEVYEFRYRGERQRQRGLLAQQVEQFAPEAVRYVDGCKRVDYARALESAVRLAA
jgi:hypothetical protein